MDVWNPSLGISDLLPVLKQTVYVIVVVYLSGQTIFYLILLNINNLYY